MAEIDRTVTVTLTPAELREAVANYVERMCAGDMPAMNPDSCAFFFADDGPNDVMTADVAVRIYSK